MLAPQIRREKQGLHTNCGKTCQPPQPRNRGGGGGHLERAEIQPSWEEAAPGAKESVTRPEIDTEALRGKRMGKSKQTQEQVQRAGPRLGVWRMGVGMVEGENCQEVR